MRTRARALLGALGRAVLRLEARLARGGAVSLAQVKLAQAVSFGEDPLLPRNGEVRSTGRKLRHPDLRVILADQELGAWALGARTIDWLEDRISTLRPSLVLEFGSGVSTLCLARFLVDLHGRDPVVRVVSVDQDEAYAAQTNELLRQNGLEAYVRLVAAPLRQQEIEGVATTCYELPADFSAVFDGRAADMLLIDGPAAEAGARFGTLPLARPYLLPSAPFVLDDGLRDGELRVARRWATLPGVRVDGVLTIDNGLVVGHLSDG